MLPLKLCINTQTPLVQFIKPGESTAGAPSSGSTVDLATLTEGVDYRYSPGGVTRMVLPLVRHMLHDRTLEEARWVALNPNGPATVRLNGVTLHNVFLAPDRMASYGKVKEAIWGRVHDLEDSDHHDDLFWTEAFSEYAYYNRITSQLIQTLDAAHDFDAFYIHDFQQLPIGHMLGTLKPKIFRWHIPFDRSTIPERWHALMTTYLNSYDAIVVSSPRYAESLKAFGYTGRIVQICPYVDPKDYAEPPAAEVATVASRFGLRPDDVVALVVARMDPVKAHDKAIEALGEIATRYPHLKLVLVGNGSFSSSRSGLGLSKSDRWRAHLEGMVKDGKLEGRVVFTGHLSQHELDCFYQRCDFTILPSVREGFGLVAVESWLHRRPAIVTSRAGIADLIKDGTNGLLFDPDEPGALTTKMQQLLRDRSGKLKQKLTREGFKTAKRCSIDAAVTAERDLLHEILETEMVDLYAMFWPFALAGLTLLLTWPFALLASWLIGRVMRQSSPQVTAGARRLGAIVVWLIGATLAIQELGVSPNILILVIALLGIAASIALREPLSNFGAKYFTDIYTPFKVGDSVRVHGYSGKVIAINAITTVLLAEDEQLISIPNSIFIREVVVNTSPEAWKEVTIPISIGPNVDLPAFESELLKTLSKLKIRLDRRFPPVLTTKSRTAQSTDLTLTVMLRRPEERDVITVEVNKRVTEVLQHTHTHRS